MSSLRPRGALGVLAALASVLTLAWGLAAASAADREVHVRIVQVKATGTRAPGKSADLDRDLEPLRAHLEALPVHFARFEYLDKAVRHGPSGTPLLFDLRPPYHATATPSFEGERISLVLRVTKAPKPGSDAKPETVFETTTSLKDSATSVQAIADAAPGGGTLLLAVTASKDPF